MLQGEMSLEEMKTYTGISRKPADFRDYWVRAKAELSAVPQDISIKPAAFSAPFAECYDLHFPGIRGSMVHARYVKPAQPQSSGRKKIPGVVKFHGYTGNAGDWFLLLPYAAAGMSIFAMDCRGQGGSSSDPAGGDTLRGHIIRGLDYTPEDMHYRQIYLDALRMVEVAASMEEVDENRIGLFGDSQGGALTLAAAALAEGVNRAAPRFPFLCDIRRTFNMGVGGAAYQEITDYLRRKDPRHESIEKIFYRLGYIDIINLAPDIRCRTFFTVGLSDDVCPPSTQFAAFNRINADKLMDIYPDYGHEPVYPDTQDRVFTFMTEMLGR